MNQQQQRAVVRQALTWMDEIHLGNMTPMAEDVWNKATAALRQLLEQPEPVQEPVSHPFEDPSVISALAWAAGLIQQEYHAGHNGADSWLMNYADIQGERIRLADHREWEKVHGRWKPITTPPAQQADHSEQHLDMVAVNSKAYDLGYRAGLVDGQRKQPTTKDSLTVDHGDELTIAYLDGVHTGKKIAKREWVGLDADDLAPLRDPGFIEGAKWADAKLREKNGGTP
jgi:hypothetical protein